MGNVAYPFNFCDVSDDFEKSMDGATLTNIVDWLVILYFVFLSVTWILLIVKKSIGQNEGREYMVNFVERVYNEIKDIMNEQLNGVRTFGMLVFFLIVWLVTTKNTTLTLIVRKWKHWTLQVVG